MSIMPAFCLWDKKCVFFCRFSSQTSASGFPIGKPANVSFAFEQKSTFHHLAGRFLAFLVVRLSAAPAIFQLGTTGGGG